MTDKRQVIYDIERCISHVPDACRDCSHYTGTVELGCMENLMSDALSLLKEQEAVEPIRINTNYEQSYTCGKCGGLVNTHFKYCPYCGRAVIWNA